MEFVVLFFKYVVAVYHSAHERINEELVERKVAAPV
jgi:hypothetical protein